MPDGFDAEYMRLFPDKTKAANGTLRICVVRSAGDHRISAFHPVPVAPPGWSAGAYLLWFPDLKGVGSVPELLCLNSGPRQLKGSLFSLRPFFPSEMHLTYQWALWCCPGLRGCRIRRLWILRGPSHPFWGWKYRRIPYWHPGSQEKPDTALFFHSRPLQGSQQILLRPLLHISDGQALLHGFCSRTGSPDWVPAWRVFLWNRKNDYTSYAFIVFRRRLSCRMTYSSNFSNILQRYDKSIYFRSEATNYDKPISDFVCYIYIDNATVFLQYYYIVFLKEN